MINRILIVVMLIFTLFEQYAGLPPYGAFSDTVSVSGGAMSFSGVGTLSPETSAVSQAPAGAAASPPASSEPQKSAAVSPPTDASPVPGASPPTDASHGQAVPPPTEASPAPPVTGTDTTSPSAIEAEISQENDLGPLTDHLPSFDTASKTAAVFEKDMNAIVKNAVGISKIKCTYGIFIMDLSTGIYFGINENLTRTEPSENVPEGYFNSASVIKLFQGYIFCDMLRRGELDEKKLYYDKVTGRKFRILPMIKSMISYSDNNYSNACLRIVDNKKSNEVLKRLGIENSRLYGEMSGAVGYSRQNNIEKYGTDKRCARITPMDAGLILYNIYRNKYTDPYMKALNEALLGNVYNTRIPVGVRRVSQKYYIAHKTGTNSALGVYNDAAIVYTKNPFILVVFTHGAAYSAGHSFIRSLAEQLTRYFE